MSPPMANRQSGRLSYAIPDTVTTTIFISNLHCPSCVASIREALNALEPTPEFVSHSMVSHSIIIRHKVSLAIDAISQAIELAGFEVHSIFQDEPAGRSPVEVRQPQERNSDWRHSLDQAVSRWRHSRFSQSLRFDFDEMPKRQKHISNCTQCQEDIAPEVCVDSDKCSSMSEKSGPIVTETEKRGSISVKSEHSVIETEKLRPSPSEKPGPLVSTTKRTSFYDGPNRSPPMRKQSVVVIEPPVTPQLFKVTLGITGMTCSSCVSTITRLVQQLPMVKTIDINLLTNSGTATFFGKNNVDEIVTTIEDAGFDATIVKLEVVQQPLVVGPVSQLQQEKRFRVLYSVSGMTCSSCVGHLTDALEKAPWIKDVEVNLLANSASVVFIGKENLQEVQQIIEDAGFDATFDSIVEEDTLKDDVLERHMSIWVKGMFCHHCPNNIMNALNDTYGQDPDFGFEIEDPLPTQKNPIVHVRYIPAPPDFTIRHIVQTINETNPAFDASIYHPPTIEDRAREMHIQERRRILFRLILSVVIAIPTFLLGIVFMSLMSSKHPIRQYIMEPMWAGNAARVTWALFILATTVYFLAADTFHRRAIKEVKAMWRPGSRTPFLQRFYRFGSMNMLMSLGTSIAYFASVVELALAATNHSSGAMTDNYFDAVVFLTMFILIGRFLEAYSKAKTGDAVTSLGKLRPEEAILVHEEGDRKIPTDLLEIDDVVTVPHGVSPPFDGIIVEGTTRFDESSLTGESMPVPKAPGDVVYSGTINKRDPIKVRITTVSGTSMLDQIINVVREGQTRRAPVERVADRITSHFVPFVVLVAIVTWVTWLSLGTTGGIPKDWKVEGSGGWALWSLRFAIAVFVIACPCGIGLAAPTALFVGGGLAAKHGILVKGGGEAFQEASSLDCIVFDKTGTLTQGGDPAVTDHAFSGAENHDLIVALLKSLEESSNHPIARALLSFCRDWKVVPPVVENIEEVPGKGLKGTFRVANGEEVLAIVGNEAYMADHHVNIWAHGLSLLQEWQAKGQSVALVATSRLPSEEALDQARKLSGITAIPTSTTSASVAPPERVWKLAALFAIADPLRPEAPRVIKTLQNRGIDVWMLSGDNPTTARAVGAQVGIPPLNIIAGVLPDQKAEKIKFLQKTLTKSRKPSLFHIPFLSRWRQTSTKRATIAMVGDGINDAPALSTADLSIAIGSGSDIAISSSSFILITSHLDTLVTLLDLSRLVFRRVYFNFGWALVYNVIAMPVAAGVLYPITTGTKDMNMHHNGVGMEGGMGMGDSGVKHIRLDPVWASLAMALSSVSVVCSSLALRSKIPGLGFRTRKVEDVVEEV